MKRDLNVREQRLLEDLLNVIEEFEAGQQGIGAAPKQNLDRDRIVAAFLFACHHHSDQKRQSGDPFIAHPVGVTRICVGMSLDTDALCAALLHDTVEDTSATLDEVEAQFGKNVALMVDGVTKLTGISFESRDERQAENYRKMMVAMARDVRVILIKLADRLHNMRTLSSMPKQKRIVKSRETLEIYAPLAHRLGIHKIKWELEDLAFATLHPRKYDEIKHLVAQQRDERETFVREAGNFLSEELEKVGIEADISGRAKHFYSIYTKMTRKGREFNEIFDLTAMRVVVSSVEECYGTIGVIHSLWKPLPGRFKDYIAMPKANMYQALHTTVVGPEGKPLEIQIRTTEMHQLAEYGIAAHVAYKEGGKGGVRENMTWLRQLIESESEQDPAEFLQALKQDLLEDEVYVFTPKGEVMNLSAGSTPLDFAYTIHTDVGHSCVGAKVNGAIVPLHYQLRSGDIVEVLTANQGRGPSRDWLKLVRTSRARNKIRAWFRQERREDAERHGRDALNEALKKRELPPQKLGRSAMLADVMREMGFRKAEDFYVAIGQGKVPAKTAANKLIQRLRAGEVIEPDPTSLEEHPRRERPIREASEFGIVVDGVDNVSLRLAKCCRPVPGDEIVGYVSVGRGITIHQAKCRNVAGLKRSPERMVEVSWKGENKATYRVEIQVDSYDRTRLLEDLSRTLAEVGVNIVSATCTVDLPMTRSRFVIEIGDTSQLKQCINRLRHVQSVFDVYRVTPNS